VQLALGVTVMVSMAMAAAMVEAAGVEPRRRRWKEGCEGERVGGNYTLSPYVGYLY
jgi:hypothetical protein